MTIWANIAYEREVCATVGTLVDVALLHRRQFVFEVDDGSLVGSDFHVRRRLGGIHGQILHTKQAFVGYKRHLRTAGRATFEFVLRIMGFKTLPERGVQVLCNLLNGRSLGYGGVDYGGFLHWRQHPVFEREFSKPDYFL
jgi:hypothetical protein